MYPTVVVMTQVMYGQSVNAVTSKRALTFAGLTRMLMQKMGTKVNASTVKPRMRTAHGKPTSGMSL